MTIQIGYTFFMIAAVLGMVCVMLGFFVGAIAATGSRASEVERIQAEYEARLRIIDTQGEDYINTTEWPISRNKNIDG